LHLERFRSCLILRSTHAPTVFVIAQKLPMVVIIFQQPKASAESIAEADEDDDVFEGEAQKRKANDVTGGDEDESGIEKSRSDLQVQTLFSSSICSLIHGILKGEVSLYH